MRNRISPWTFADMAPSPVCTPRCPLCHAPGPAHFASLREGEYWRCPACGLTFLHPDGHPDAAAERAQYETHENDPLDPGYRRFLGRLAEPLVARLPAGAEGLDYGCGPGPALAMMLREAGFPTAVYDPFYVPDTAPLERQWDFITCTEVVEHFHHPAVEFDRLHGLLRPGGWLGVMTELLTDDARFAGWRYRRDPTHVAFYSEAVLTWIARRYGYALQRPGRNVALFCKP